ncbi:fluoride efflux transporter FluC [Nannocystaceae bacterium ST9]
MTPANQWIAVFVAGGLGASLRVLLAAWLEPLLVARLPHASVLLVNLLGCLAIGFAAVALTQAHWRVIVLSGLLGGFTTYSAFALFSVELAQAGRWGVVATQVALHLLGGIACVLLGGALARALGLASG